MLVYAISDLHLAPDESKSMDVFGKKWYDHFSKISQDWQNRVNADDVVLLPGDLSWAMRLEDAAQHIAMVCSLPGRKILLKGNHDYWWQSLSKVRKLLNGNTYVIQNDCVSFDGVVFCGSRGWKLESDNDFHEDTDRAIINRELIRLEMSLEKAVNTGCDSIILMMHYPPLSVNKQNTVFTDLIEKYPVSDVVFGHIHGDRVPEIYGSIEKSGIRYSLVSCDFLGFSLKRIK